MRILKISGKNLASLAGLFSVDFEAEPLASSGLFAISGPTGAGKSTLLDALCLALYDDTPRLLKVGGRSNLLPDVGSDTIAAQETRTLLRRGTADGYAEVDFVGNDGASYRARWSVRRSYNKTGGTLQTPSMSLHQLPGLQPMGGTKTEVKLEIVQRIGLSFEQFTRAVLLAQNEFSTFLKTEDNERGELLETLTGSTIYSEISIRAFERSKREQDTLRRLSERLADGRPLAPEARLALDARSAGADAAVAALDLRKGALEQQLRWFADASRLQQQRQLAQQALQASEQALEQHAPRRARLAQLDAVQAARPLAEERRRIDADLTQAEHAVASHQADAAQAGQQLAAATAAAQHGAGQVQQAEQAQRDAAAQLDLAKALDARLVALQPAYQQAQTASRAADQGHASARAGLQAQQAEQAQLLAAQDASSSWLARHQAWQVMAQSWPRWDVLFTQAEKAATLDLEATRAAGRLQRSAEASAARQADATASLAAAAQTLEALEQQRQQAQRELAQFDAAAVLARRRHLDQRRDQLAAAHQLHSEMTSQQARSGQLAGQHQQRRDEADQAGAAVTRELARADSLAAALTQAERSLKGAEAACAANVETLRATLAAGAPCPVCGALKHPYHHQDDTLRAMLASLQAEVTECRQQSDAHLGQLATARATYRSASAQMAALAQQIDDLQTASASLAPRWQQAADALAMPAAADASVWLTDQRAALQTAMQDIEREEERLRRAGAARDQAQAACDQAAAAHRRLSDSAALAATALAQADAEQAALADKRQQLQTQLASLLEELDHALRHADNDDDWKENWHSAPARFHAERQAESRQWLQQRSAYDERVVALATAAAQVDAASALLQRAQADGHAAHSAFAILDANLKTLRTERQGLWAGRSVAEVEAQLAGAVGQAKAQLVAVQEAHRQAEQVRIRIDEALAQAVTRVSVLRAAAQEAGTRMDAWLADWQPAAALQESDAARAALLEGDVARAAPEVGDAARAAPEVGDAARAALQALLAVPPATVERERDALRALDEQLATAATVLQERQQQCARHQEQAPTDPDASAGTVADAIATLETERKTAQAAASALHLEIAQDQARSDQAQSMLADIGAQEQIGQRWARMNELIGSADGKKFRNYAQQFTLDVLLGYANAHLHQLARRYQLERIHHAANPSLGLMVRDQDMGGELRSVHSLSGGESFLVSLALALGLASLSSNRVRVESLFIDEGFGSLDSETLRVAMDALDGLQSMGRKVGVISHVQEMTERIATKILVRPAAGGRSTVSVQ